MIILNFCYGLIWGFLRRMYGGLFPDDQYKILGNRLFQTLIMIIILLPNMYFYTEAIYNNYSTAIKFLITLCVTLWIQFQFWSRGHGATFGDMGRDKNPDVSRYNRWFKIPLDFIWNKVLYLKNNNKIFNWLLQNWSGTMYGYTYDLIYHCLRYTLCMIVPAIVYQNWIFILIGLYAAPVYELTLRFYEKNNFKWMQLPYLNSPNKLSEIEYGFIFGFLIFYF